MLKKIAVILYTIIVSSTSHAGTNKLVLELSKLSDGFFYISVFNDSIYASNFVGNFCLTNPGALRIEVRDSDNKVIPQIGLINSKCNYKTKVNIEPYHIYGRKLHEDNLRQYFGLIQGEYNVRANVCLDGGNCLYSNSLNIEL